MKYVQLLLGLILTFGAYADGKVEIKSVTAQQRYPWNGLVDIAVTMECSADDIETVECSFAATNSAAQAVLPIVDVVQNGFDAGSGVMWTRRFIWNATNDVGAVKIDDLVLTVDAKVQKGVQLWEDGPYWAECNVGASRPEEYGYYFWWGDTIGRKRNDSNNGWLLVKDGASYSATSDDFPYYNNIPTYGKDNSDLRSAGYIDSTGNLVAAHDAATAHLGVPWRMPTEDEIAALINYCTTKWITTNGINGRLVTGNGAYASKSIFLPAAGYGGGSFLYDAGSVGYYWSSTPSSDTSAFAEKLCFWSSGFKATGSSRYDGQSVRPVRRVDTAGTAASQAGVTTHLKLNCLAGVRVCSANGESLRFDARWYEDGDEVRIFEDGALLTNGVAGVYVWQPTPSCCATRHILKLEVLSSGQIVGTQTAKFESAATLTHSEFETKKAVAPTSGMEGSTAEIRCSRCGEIVQAATKIPALGYIRNVTARQLWPHNKVALEFTVAEDIGDVRRANEDLSVWCARGIVTNVATQILGDRSVKPGAHRIVWDMDAEGLRFVNAKTTFGVSIEKIDPLVGVQLWENGPYWAECNVGALKPEEYGYYFCWGDTVGYKRSVKNDGWVSVIDGADYSFGSLNCPTSGKDNSALQSAGYIDPTGNLAAAHDAATVHLGTRWRMPTNAEIEALVSNCIATWITTNGVKGMLVRGRGEYASKRIFLPAAGVGIGFRLELTTDGFYWSSTPSSGFSDNSGYLEFDSGLFRRNYYFNRFYGHSVRPVREFSK